MSVQLKNTRSEDLTISKLQALRQLLNGVSECIQSLDARVVTESWKDHVTKEVQFVSFTVDRRAKLISKKIGDKLKDKNNNVVELVFKRAIDQS